MGSVGSIPLGPAHYPFPHFRVPTITVSVGGEPLWNCVEWRSRFSGLLPNPIVENWGASSSCRFLFVPLLLKFGFRRRGFSTPAIDSYFFIQREGGSHCKFSVFDISGGLPVDEAIHRRFPLGE